MSLSRRRRRCELFVIQSVDANGKRGRLPHPLPLFLNLRGAPSISHGFRGLRGLRFDARLRRRRPLKVHKLRGPLEGAHAQIRTSSPPLTQKCSLEPRFKLRLTGDQIFSCSFAGQRARQIGPLSFVGKVPSFVFDVGRRRPPGNLGGARGSKMDLQRFPNKGFPPAPSPELERIFPISIATHVWKWRGDARNGRFSTCQFP